LQCIYIIIIIRLLSFIDPSRFTQPLDIEIVSGLHDIVHNVETRDKQYIQYIQARPTKVQATITGIPQLVLWCAVVCCCCGVQQHLPTERLYKLSASGEQV
jgi:hypothetical protein